MKTIFKFADGGRISGDAQVVGERLEVLRQRGELTPKSVVADARSSKSVLHKYFEWDDEKAAEQWRVEQAGQLIRCVVLIEEQDDGETLTTRAFVKISGNDQYESIQVVLSDSDMRKRLLDEVKSNIDALRMKVKSFNDFADLLGALDQVSVIAEEKIAAV